MVPKQGIAFSLMERNVKNGHTLEVSARMSNKKYYVFVISFLFLITLISGVYGLEEKKIKQADNLVSLDEISVQERIGVLNQKIREKNLSWVAGETSMSKLSKEERRARLGLIKPPFQKQNTGIETNYGTLPLSASYPSSLDWRNKDGNDWISPIKNQGGCGSCWAFSSVAVVEARAKIELNKSSYNIDLSEQDVVSCNTGGGSCSGGWESVALAHMKNTGIVKESCFAYTATNNSCSNKCSNWQNEILKVQNYNSISASAGSIKQAVNDYGPVTVYMYADDDFMDYLGGVYSHTVVTWTGGFHSISIVGYNDSGQYWIAKNSWGTGWGESGYFRIAYSENVLDYYAWYNDPYDVRTFFLDGSYYVTGTDIGTIPTVNSAQANITYAKSTTLINFTVYAKANSIKQLSSVKINGTSMNGSLSTGGTFSTIKNLSVFGCQGFEENCILTINATDDADKSNTSEKITVVVDDLAPRVTANPTVYPTNQNAARNGSLITLNATIIDLGTGVNATVNASQVNSSLGIVILNNISGFYTNSTVIVNISDGTYRLNITAYDNAGNKNDTVQISVIVDNTPPSNITINPVSYQRGSAANNRSIIGFSASANDPLINSTSAGLKNASVNASLINNTGRIELTNQSGFWRGNVTFDKFQPDDYYLLNVTFYDNASNMNNSMQINISIDNTPPSVSDVSVSSQFINISSFTNISANITDAVSQVNQNEVLARVTYPNGTSINYPLNATGGSLFYYNFTDTAQYGRFNVTILANDTTGNINNTQRIQFATVFITNNESVVIQANNSTVVSAPLSNTTLYLFTNNTSVGAVNITQSRINMTSNELNITNPGIYVNVSVNSSIRNNLSYVIIYVNYTDAEVSSYIESSLRLYRWNISSSSWDRLSGAGSFPYVNNAGVDTANNFVWANLTELSEFAVSGELYVPPQTTTSSSSSGGGGGGGGGGTSGENYSNIELKEKRDLYIYKDRISSYKFNTTDPIMYVNITGNISAGEVTTMVEVLRNTSSIVKNNSVPGIVYKNMNIWVGTSGFATPKNIQKGVIRFRVLNSWLENKELASGDVRLVKWDGSIWAELVTYETTKDSEHVYYESLTDSFSPFAITVFRSSVPPVEVTIIPVMEHEKPALEETDIKLEKTSGFNGVLLAMTVVLVIIVTILAALYMKERKKI